jgi:Mg2+/Co2+ transporter CorB
VRNRSDHKLDSIPLWVHIVALVGLLMISAFFSISETSMMALNRYRLKNLVKKGKRGAKLASDLLGQTDKLLGTILLGNNVVNTLVTALVTALAIRNFGNNDTVIAIATAIVALAIIVFCEITPKVIGATFPEKVALPSSYVLSFLMKLSAPAVWFVNLLVAGLLKLFRIDMSAGQSSQLSSEELRTVVLESTQLAPSKHGSILLNLYDLEHITVDDLMTPRNRVEALNVATSEEGIRQQLATCYHNKLPVFEGELNSTLGILHVRRTLTLMQAESFNRLAFMELLQPPYFVPSGTPAFTQLQYFQENKQRLALVVDEYGEVTGLVTLEDIIEELIGKFTTSAPGGKSASGWNEANEALVEGFATLRELNRRFETNFPLDGPKTINGWLLEQLQDLPDAAVSIKRGNLVMEIVQIEDRTIRSVRLHRLEKTR